MARSSPKRKPADRSSVRNPRKSPPRPGRGAHKSTRNKMNILPLEKGKVGRPQYEPTQRDRTFVIAMAAHGAVHDEIAQVLGISDVTLRKHFNYELENGLPRAHADVAHTLFVRRWADRKEIGRKRATQPRSSTRRRRWVGESPPR